MTPREREWAVLSPRRPEEEGLKSTMKLVGLRRPSFRPLIEARATPKEDAAPHGKSFLFSLQWWLAVVVSKES